MNSLAMRHGKKHRKFPVDLNITFARSGRVANEQAKYIAPLLKLHRDDEEKSAYISITDGRVLTVVGA